MLIFLILLHFGLKVLSLSAARTDTLSTHICVDYNVTTNATTVAWAVSSPSPVNVSKCDLAYHQEGSSDPVQIHDHLPSHGSRVIEIPASSSSWTIRVTCLVDSGEGFQSPEVHIIPGKDNLSHLCSDSGLGNLVPSEAVSDIPIVVCIWRPELQKDYAVVRWQPVTPHASPTSCMLHLNVSGNLREEAGLPIDAMQSLSYDGGRLSAWVTCSAGQGQAFSSGKAQCMQGTTTGCSVEEPLTLSPTSPDTSDNNSPTNDTPSHNRLGITNMTLGLSLAAVIFIVGCFITVGFIRWFRWQRRRRRERLIRNGEPANDQSAMDEFQQMM